MRWPYIELGQFALSRGGVVNPEKFQDEVFDLFSIPAYDSGNPEIVKGSEIGSSKKIVEPGDILLSKIVPHIRRVWIVGDNHGRRQIASSEWIVYRTKKIDPDYLRYFLLADNFRAKFMGTVKGVGGSLLRATPSLVDKIEIPLPPLETQKQIAAILEKADQLRKDCQQMEKELNNLAQSVFMDMFGDPVINPKGWRIGCISDLMESVCYGTSEKSSEEVLEYPVLRMNNITYEGMWDFTSLKYMNLTEKDKSKYLVHKRELLFNRTNSKELVGKTAVFRENKPMAFAGYLIRARCNKLANPEYVSGIMNSRYGKQTLLTMCKSIVGMANINAKEFQKIKLPIPPIDLQNEYEVHIARILESKRGLERERKAYETLFNALMQKAFKGELKIKNKAA